MRLHLGVVEIPYANGRLTTGDVAGFLETRYGVMDYFWELNKNNITAMLEQALTMSVGQLMAGRAPSENPFLAGESQIEKAFKNFLTTKQMDHKVAGVPTAASLSGKSSRFKNKRGPTRPSFIDTGAYENSFKAWMEF